MAHCLLSVIGRMVVRVIFETVIFKRRQWTPSECEAVIVNTKERIT